ncbi:hypothetical protein GCM10020227_61640 [Streptomyces flavovirens]
MVHLLVEEVVGLGEAVERHPDQRTGAEIHGLRQKPLHTPHGLGVRILVFRQIDQRHVDVGALVDALEGDTVPLTEGTAQRLRLGHGVADRPA